MENKIECPNCGHAFDVEEALSGKIEDHLKKEFERKTAEEAKRIKEIQSKLDAEKSALEDAKAELDKEVQSQLKAQLEAAKKQLTEEARKELEVEYQSIEEELKTKKAENLALKKRELEVLKLEKEMASKQQELELELKKKLLEDQSEIEAKAAAKEREKFEFERLEMQKKLDDAVKSAEDLKRKAKQGSVQLQGEVQELALEDLLRRLYPFDSVEEVPKGVTGADCIQTVRNAVQVDCGRIVYESKSTQAFQSSWLLKIKNDMIQVKGDVPVLVTETMPEGMDGFGIQDGVWICQFHEVRGVSLIIREFLIKLQKERVAEENKGDKMVLLYNYLTGDEFHRNIKMVIENYQAMTNQLEREKKAYKRIWKQREKQIHAVQTNLAELFGSIQGIAGDALPNASDDVLPLESGTDD